MISEYAASPLRRLISATWVARRVHHRGRRDAGGLHRRDAVMESRRLHVEHDPPGIVDPGHPHGHHRSMDRGSGAQGAVGPRQARSLARAWGWRRWYLFLLWPLPAL